MKRRYALFGITAMLAVSLAIPAFGGPSNPVASSLASAKGTAKKALKKAKQASKDAAAAQSTADSAQSDANSAQNTADAAQTAATNAQTAADAAQTTANGKYGTQDFVVGTATPSDSSSNKVAFAGCPAGFVYTGGGHSITGAVADITVTSSSPYINNNWSVVANEIGGGTGSNWSLRANVMCVGP